MCGVKRTSDVRDNNVRWGYSWVFGPHISPGVSGVSGVCRSLGLLGSLGSSGSLGLRVFGSLGLLGLWVFWGLWVFGVSRSPGLRVYRRLLNSGDPLQWRCRNKDLVVVLLSLHMNRNKLKGSEDFNWNNIGLASLWFEWFCRHAWFRLMISCRLVIRTC